MFWRYGGYTNISALDSMLEKADLTLEELLDESDLIQELKQHHAKLVSYLCNNSVLEKLLDYVVAPKLEPVQDETADSEPKAREWPYFKSQPYKPEDDVKNKQRNRYAYLSAEILSSDNWTIVESLIENQKLLKKFWDFLKLSPPLDPLQASYFTKVNEALLDKKTEEMLDLFKTFDGAVQDMLRHVDSPMIMDLLLKIISLEKAEGGTGIVDWLHRQDIIPNLLNFLSPEHPGAIQTSAGDFLKAIITISANTSQNQQSCVGPNELTRQLVSKPYIEQLISYMLQGGNSLTVGVGIVIEVIRKNNSDYDPYISTEDYAPSSGDPIYLGTLLRLFAQRVPDFMALMLSPIPEKRKELKTAFGDKIEPLGFDRFKICELMAELLHCSNMGLLNESDSEELIRRRDAERERLRVEGKLRMYSDDLSAMDFKIDGIKKLQVQNASDDDGFERVSHSDDDETDDFRNLNNPSSSEKNDEYLLDRPFSPTLQTRELLEPDMIVQPLSPSKAIDKKINSPGKQSESQESFRNELTKYPLTLDDEIVTSPQGKQNEVISPPQEEKPTTENQISDSSNIKSIEEARDYGEQLSEISQIEKHHTDISAKNSTTEAHPEDKPAPLSLKKASNLDDTLDELSTQEHSFPDVHVSQAKKDTKDLDACNSKPNNVNDDTNHPIVGDFLKFQFVKHKVVPTILDFFFSFPWNNFLHNVVYDIVQQVFNGPMDRGFNKTLAFDLFETGNITTKIVNGQSMSDKMTKMRLGYMGHLTLIAEEVVKFTERHPPQIFPDSVLGRVMDADWILYVEVTLTETRERDNAILGGYRPIKPVGQRQPVPNTDALTEAGLNQVGSNDEDGGIAGAEHITDVTPPAAPPPPALNIPPSRARRQLAVMLALHKAEKNQSNNTLTEKDDAVSCTTEAEKITSLDDNEADTTIHTE
ncbi:hypothetical protein K3495_g7649 [Podosphaera aphanis]|nr:hypothetical protein K3495_g7649 [Podosphaera aphanis]